MKRSFTLLLTAILAVSCIDNDLDYPLVPGGFVTFEVDGQKSVEINSKERTVAIELEETALPDSLPLLSYTLTDSTFLDTPLPQVLDLSSPFKVKMHTWQNWEWTIRASRVIKRSVNCDKQVGEARFNEASRTIALRVTEEQLLDRVRFNSMKLGPEGSRIVSTTGYENDGEVSRLVTRECEFPITLDCILTRSFTVVYKGRSEVWNLEAVKVLVETEIRGVAPWCHSADIEAIFNGKGSPEVQWRRAGEEQWTVCDSVTVDGTDIHAKILNLEELTEYQVRVIADGKESAVETFRTDREIQLHNMGFDDWYLGGKIWYPYPADAHDSLKVWDSANKATANFLGSITTPVEDFVAVEGEGKKAAKLESTYAVVKFAAGNLFTGQFVSLKGLGADLAWGIPFDSKPKALHGYYCYQPKPIDYYDADHAYLKGKNDIGQIQVILTDWPQQFHVLSAEEVFVDVKNDPNIIAYVNFETSDYDEGYVEFTLPLEYRSYRTPKYIVVVAASSRYGDFYTGGKGSALYLDEFSFIYE
ncbi:MAG: PCMD domain-containing protein [Bacteroidales bacterium]|nr:PCMD domain-containing protein [Bacteroidales bacterium]